MRIMMSAAGSAASVSILRHLRSLGHETVGLNANKDVAPLAIACCDQFFVCPRADSSEYLPFLCERLTDVDLFIPFIDEELVTIARGWQLLPREISDRIAVSDPGVLLDCVDKCRFQELCEAYELPIAPRATAAPAFFKPRVGRGGKGVMRIRDPLMLASLAHEDGVIQQAVEGDEYTVDAIFDRSGELVATSPRRRVSASGVSTLGEVIPDEKLSLLAASLAKHWTFRYAINFQVIRDRDGQDWIIELNPRLAGSAIFSTLAGCDPFAATIALWKGERWSGQARRLRVVRYWQEFVDEGEG